MRTITAMSRPFVLMFKSSGHRYPLTPKEAQRLLDENPIFTATKYRVVFHGHNTSRVADRAILTPATRGGGPAFIVNA